MGATPICVSWDPWWHLKFFSASDELEGSFACKCSTQFYYPLCWVMSTKLPRKMSLFQVLNWLQTTIVLHRELGTITGTSHTLNPSSYFEDAACYHNATPKVRGKPKWSKGWLWAISVQSWIFEHNYQPLTLNSWLVMQSNILWQAWNVHLTTIVTEQFLPSRNIW